MILQLEDTPGIQGWHWEIAVTYTDSLADLVINGTTSTIQKTALLGSHRDIAAIKYQDSRPPLESAGLIDMLNFHMLGDSLDESGIVYKYYPRNSAVLVTAPSS